MNAKYNVRVTLVAKADLKGTLNYIRADRPAAADRFELRFAERMKSLRRHPERFPKIREQFHAKFVYRHILVNPYRIIFRIFGTKFLVVRILHQTRLFTFHMLFGLD